jgi:natural product biosynthesis luciferase-like monooxygenase protein/amino acid adenylation domain-containing protein
MNELPLKVSDSTINTEFSTLVEILRWRALDHPDQKAYTFLADEENENSLTYSALDQQARAIGSMLQKLNATGERILLLYPSGLDYIAAFFGCLYAGAVAVPAYPPHSNRSIGRIQSIVADAQAKFVLTTSQMLSKSQRFFSLIPDLQKLQWLVTDTESIDGNEAAWQKPQITESTLAFLQYTSGSTAAPKGVMVSHSNLMSNHRIIQRAVSHPPGVAAVSWLPLFHDMGLVLMLHAVYGGLPCIFLSPSAFVQSPLLWLQAISRYQAHTSVAPNFAYDLCVQKISLEQRETLDLSSWKVALCGAEPVRYQTLANFADYFAPCGFHQEALSPCYGLAEATIFVSAYQKSLTPIVCHFNKEALERNQVILTTQMDEKSIECVSCGHTELDTRVVIADPETCMLCSPGAVGEVWVRGPHVTQGYWNRIEETEKTFCAYLKDTGEGPFLRTGDLGFFFGEGLFITGRLKDLIIIRGQNYYPQDIEHTAELSHPALKRNGSAAFSLAVAGKERVILVMEIDRQYRNQDPQELFSAIRQTVLEEYNLHVDTIILIKPGSILKTSSGKIQRRACRKAFLEQSLAILFADLSQAVKDLLEQRDEEVMPIMQSVQSPTDSVPLEIAALQVYTEPENAHNEQRVTCVKPDQSFLQQLSLAPLSQQLVLLEQYLQQQTAQVLERTTKEISSVLNIRSLGLDSLMIMSIVNNCQRDLLMTLDVGQFYEHTSFRSLAIYIAEEFHRAYPTEKKDMPIRAASPTIQSQERQTIIPASFAQQRLWFLDRLKPESPAYLIPRALCLDGAINAHSLEYALQALISRHEILRTTFEEQSGQLVQVIHPAGLDTLPVIDLQGLADKQREPEARRLACQEGQHPCDLAAGPLLRMYLLRLEPQEHVLLLTLHHIITDGWSNGILVRELNTLYHAHVLGESSPLSPLPIQYADYALWQQEWLQGEVLQTQLAYWNKQLAKVSPLALPTDHPRPAVQTYQGAVQQFQLSAELSEALLTLSQQENVTLFMTLLAAFQVLLARYTGQTDISVGTPIANRRQAEIEGLIGFFVNTLVMRTDLSGNPTFEQVLQRVRKVCLEAYAHQDLPFEKVVEELVPQRDLSRSQLFQVMLVLQNAPLAQADLAGVRVEPWDVETLTSKFDLTLSITQTDQGLSCALEYSTDLFELQTITCLLGHWQTLLQGIITNPQVCLSDLPLLTDDEREHLLGVWNGTRTAYPHNLCIHQLFEQQVKRTPDAVALVFEDEMLTYDALNRHANQLAHHLQELGVGPEGRVGICMERSIEMLVGLLAVLKAGGAYLPLDPTYPQERLAFIIADSQVQVVLIDSLLEHQWLLSHNLQILDLDREWQVMKTQRQDNLHGTVVSENLAYLIYTSGSTGKPKGTMVMHRNVTNFFTAMDDRLGNHVPGIWLALTSISFDISVLELFWTLTRGFQVVLRANYDYSSQHKPTSKKLEFSLFYFANDTTEQSANKYRLLLEGAKFADTQNFTAIWTPERHFHAFGGLYPNPSVTSAAIAAVTQRVKIRAGSVVLPLHDPVRVAEEWAVVDNLSGGRVGISFATGWHANDFVLAPDQYTDRKKVMIEKMETVRQLWRGETMALQGPKGNEVPVKMYPRPIQPELPIWITSGGSPETFRQAGEMGVNLLTHLLGQSTDELAEKIALYREARQKQGHPGPGHVTLMIHTFLGTESTAVREQVRDPFSAYLRSSVELMRTLAESLGYPSDMTRLSEEDLEAILAHGFDRYYETSGLMGTVSTCLPMVERLKEIGVDEVACLIDFGVDEDSVLASLHELAKLKHVSHKQRTFESIPAQIKRLGITHLQCTPSQASMLLLEPEALSALASLEQILLGGEAFPVSLARQLEPVLQGDLYNMYGPTETTIWSTMQRVHKGAKSISLGRPISNTQVYLLDKHLQLLPMGVAGELFLGGKGVVRGYVNHPELTAERFLPDPFSGEAGACIYKTGDLARYLPDGTIEFLGRIDQQVKMRGYRIELGEIEAVLCSHPAVRQCVVLAREDVPGDKRLVAYVVSSQELMADGLRSFLQKQLPAYLIPSQFLLLDAIPLTPNSKVDRKALPIPEQWHREGDEKPQGARTAIEELLVELWCKVLGRTQVGIHDNFFELGGHSLLVTQLLARVRAILGVELPVRTVFEAPTVADLAYRVEQVLRRGEDLKMPPLTAGERPQGLPLSFAQQRLWFLDQLQPESVAYLVPTALRMDGELNVKALKHSFQELVQRHESLRTTFVEQADQPIQIIHSAGHVCMPVIDLRGLTGEHREQEARRLANQERQCPCNLATGPLLRTYLLRLEPQEHILLLTLHHIITDGWSDEVLVYELTTLYQANLSGQPSPLAPLPLQYADYALWQREWLQGEVLEAQLAYWQTQLAGIPPLELPTNHPRPPVQTYRGTCQVFQLSPILSEQLVALSRQQNVTLFMTLLAAFQVLLMRYTGQTDISVGTLVANRRQAEIESLIGFFINTLVMRTDLSGNPTFEQVLQRVREVCLGAYAHQDPPFEHVLETVAPPRDLSRSPLFQVMLVLQNVPHAQVNLAGVRVEPWDVGTIANKFDLTDLGLSITQTGQGLSCILEYNCNLFEPETITYLFNRWQILLEGLIANPQVYLSDLPLLTDDERECLLVAWNATRMAYPQEYCIHQLFEQQAERTPDAVALVFEEQHLTYGQLNGRANQLAHHLQKLGVGPEVLVGICMERSIGMVVGLLAVLKAGGAYVPLDPADPCERLTYMLQDAGVTLLITQQHLQRQLPKLQTSVLYVDADWEKISQECQEKLHHDLTSANLAYVIYTSGSTGQPKGVLVNHASLVNCAFAWRHAYSLNARCQCHFQMANVTFDVFLGDLTRALASGAKLVLCPRDLLLTPEKLYALMRQEQVDGAEFVPAVMRGLVTYLQETSQSLDFMRLLIIGSDIWYSQDLERLQSVCPSHTWIMNSYGVTEATIDSSYFRCEGKGLSTKGLVPIGHPFRNMQLYLLDSSLQPVPIGVSGELYIGGLGVARGYLNHQELTASRFIPHPWSLEPGSRLYKTGDLGRYLPDGTIEILGRIDHQVKLRGFRIELGEIEAVLGQHPMIQDCVVLAREDMPGEKRLVAYVVGSQELTATGLRSFLQEKLPAYMIPSQFLPLDVIPLTPNGKVDRRALPPPTSVRSELEMTFVSPRTPAEEVVAGIWAKILGVDHIGPHDNFFELGGHSLHGVQMISQLRDIFQVELPLRSLFEKPTVESLVSDIAQLRGGREIIEAIAEVFQEIEHLSEEDIKAILYN